MLALGGGCTSSSLEDGERSRTRRNLEGGSCEAFPNFSSANANFEPELQWEWTGSTTLPEFKQVMMTPIVVEVNGDGIPDIIFSSFAGNALSHGVLRAISGNDGHELWANTNPLYATRAVAGLAAGDIDGDGLVEICGIPSNGRGIICYENDGTFKFRSAEDAFDYNEWGGPSLADLDGDGTVEILDGNRVYSNTGALKWVGSDGMGGAQYTGPTSFGADIDQDGKQELINGRAVYRHDGTLLCANTSIPQGTAAVGNFDGDIQGELVVAGHSQVSLLNDNCALLWTATIPGGCAKGCGGAPILADVDSDGLPEIAVSGDNAFSVFETDGTLKWTSTIQDWSSGKASAAAFDFEDDGKIELIFADEVALRIYNGQTGAVRFQTRHSTGTTHENPVIADVDGDGAADIVVAANNIAYPPYNGIRVFHDRLEGWPHARRIWNQHAYSVTNINDDGTIPKRPLSHWRRPKLNTFHSNPANYLGEEETPPGNTDLIPDYVVSECMEDGSLLLGAWVTNQGIGNAPAGIQVAFYRGSPGSGGPLLGVTTIQEPLPARGSVFVSLVFSPPPAGLDEFYVVVDDDGTGTGSEAECNENNNTAATPVAVSCAPPNQPPVALCRNVTVSANASCQGSASVDNGSHDPDQQPGPFSVSQAPAGPLGLGNHQVTLTASDGEASAQCVGTVSVVDTAPPAISCPISVEAKVLSGEPGVRVNFTASASDNCGEPQMDCTHPPGSLFLLGLTQVSCTATDSSGNSASCRFGVRVTIDDISLP